MRFISINEENTCVLSIGFFKKSLFRKHYFPYGFFRYFFDVKAQRLLEYLCKNQEIGLSSVIFFSLKFSTFREYFSQIKLLEYSVIRPCRMWGYMGWKPWLYIPTNGFIIRGLGLMILLCLFALLLKLNFFVAHNDINTAQAWLTKQRQFCKNGWFSKQAFLIDGLERLQSWPIVLHRIILNKNTIRVWAKPTDQATQAFFSNLDKNWTFKKLKNNTFLFELRLSKL